MRARIRNPPCLTVLHADVEGSGRHLAAAALQADEELEAQENPVSRSGHSSSASARDSGSCLECSAARRGHRIVGVARVGLAHPCQGKPAKPAAALGCAAVDLASSKAHAIRSRTSASRCPPSAHQGWQRGRGRGPSRWDARRLERQAPGGLLGWAMVKLTYIARLADAHPLAEGLEMDSQASPRPGFLRTWRPLHPHAYHFHLGAEMRSLRGSWLWQGCTVRVEQNPRVRHARVPLRLDPGITEMIRFHQAIAAPQHPSRLAGAMGDVARAGIVVSIPIAGAGGVQAAGEEHRGLPVKTSAADVRGEARQSLGRRGSVHVPLHDLRRRRLPDTGEAGCCSVALKPVRLRQAGALCVSHRRRTRRTLGRWRSSIWRSSSRSS